MIKECINEQELLDICLSLVASEDLKKEDGYFSGPAGRVITLYSAMELTKEKELKGESLEFTDEEVSKRVHQLCIDKLLEIMTKKNLLSVDFSGDKILYSAN
jgi:hypothetical protein